jgi:hypothetical protein
VPRFKKGGIFSKFRKVAWWQKEDKYLQW